MSAWQALFPRIALTVVLGLLLLHVIGAAYWGHERMLAAAESLAISTVERALPLLSLDDAELTRIDQLTGDEFRAVRADAPAPSPLQPWPHTQEVRQVILETLASKGFQRADEVEFSYTWERSSHTAIFALSIPDGARWMIVRVSSRAAHFGERPAPILFMSVIALIVLASILLATRRTTRYLSKFVAAAERVGANQPFEPLPTGEGPTEVRRAAAAFNEMRGRVSDLLAERSQMLAAVSHDVRTIATRLKLRSEYIQDDRQRARAEQDLNDMSAILNEALAFARDDASEEPRSLLDLRSLLQSIVDTRADVGEPASMRAGPALTLSGQPTALKRAFENLLDNAIRYGGQAIVEINEHREVIVQDAGPGMSAAEGERATQPFARLENSRNRRTGGTGLGLAIASNVFQRHFATMRFARHPEGFRVIVRFEG